MSAAMLLRRSFLAVVFAALAGCASLAPDAPEARKQSDALLEAQLAQARQKLASGRPPRVVYAGFALHSGSHAFRGDVQKTEELVRRIDPEAVSFKLDNPAGPGHDLPFATRENVQAVLQAIGTHVRDNDRIVLLFASHGAPQALSVRAANRDFGMVSARDLQQWLAPLRGRPTLLLVSACYSGSFIPPLQGPSRIILTAAAPDRSSFGCQFQSSNTYFIEELLRNPAATQMTVLQLMEEARAGVEKRESARKLTPSQPQVFVGPAVAAWARQPIGQWLQERLP